MEKKEGKFWSLLLWTMEGPGWAVGSPTSFERSPGQCCCWGPCARWMDGWASEHEHGHGVVIYCFPVAKEPNPHLHTWGGGLKSRCRRDLTESKQQASKQAGWQARQEGHSAASCLRDMEGAGRRNFDSATLFPSLSTQERTACREQPERRASIGAGLEVQYAQPIVGGRKGREKACATPSVWTLVSIDAAMRSPRAGMAL
jgi:hypothetical protein